MPSLEEPSKPRKIEEPSKPKKGRDLKPGHVLENRYEILEKLGSGASATVYAVQDLVKGRKVALKHFESYKGASRQCAAEGDNMKRLNSVETAQAFVPDVYDTFISEGRHCLTMEFYDCKTLKDELKEANRKGLPVKDIRKYMKKLFETFVFMSDSRIQMVHSDVKPDNVIISRYVTGGVRLIDYGLANKTSAWKANMYIQSRWYRAPEVLLGLPATSAIDMWSAGCVLVELFAGVPPFRGNDSFDQMKMITDAVGMPSDKMRKRCARETLEKLDEIGEEINERWSAADTRYPEYKDESVESRLTRRLLSFRHSLGAHNEDTNEENAQLTHLICQILVVDPLSRITAAQALEHPFFLGSSASKYASSPTASTSAKLATLGASTPVKAVTFDATHKSPEKALSKTLPLPRTSANGVNMSIVSSPKAATTLSRSHSNESDARQPGDKVIGKRSAEKGIPRAASTAIFRAAASSSGGTSSEQSLNSSLNASLDLGGTPIPKAKQQPFALEIQASPKAKAGDKKTFDRMGGVAMRRDPCGYASRFRTEAMQSTTTPRWRREG